MIRTIAISWGRYGGFYLHRNRVCLGWVAVTWLPWEIDDIKSAAARDEERKPA